MQVKEELLDGWLDMQFSAIGFKSPEEARKRKRDRIRKPNLINNRLVKIERRKRKRRNSIRHRTNGNDTSRKEKSRRM